MTVPKILIDGYNLLFQSQLVGKGRGRNWLPAARGRLVKLLHDRLTAQELSTTQIVFDAPRVGPAPKIDPAASLVNIVYAVDHAEADDLLEEIIRQHPTPKQLTVVSSDLRIRRCAQAQRAVSLGAEQFLKGLERRSASTVADQAQTISSDQGDEPPAILSEEEIAYWLREFED